MRNEKESTTKMTSLSIKWGKSEKSTYDVILTTLWCSTIHRIFRDERDERVKTVEDALFRANDAYDDLKEENDKMREELNLTLEQAERFHEESEKWNEDKEKLEQQLRYVTELWPHHYVILEILLRYWDYTT